MSLREQAVKNVTTTWLSLLVQAAVGFFLSPFLVHRLGNDAFSIWILIFTVTGYFNLFDFGIRSSVVKYTAQFVATDDRDELSRYLSTSLAFYSAVGLVILAMTVAGFFYLNILFKIPDALLHLARILLLLAGTSVALNFPLSVFAGALEGLQRFSWLQLTQIGVVLLRAFLFVVVLMRGRGLLAIGVIGVALSILSYVIFTCLALYALPVRMSPRLVDAKTFRKLAGYGLVAFVIVASERLRFQSDAMVIGAMLSTTVITSFSIAARLVEYSSYAVRGMSQIFTPMSSQFHAAGDLPRLQRMFVAGNRASALIAFPICIALVLVGRPILEAWMGAAYLGSYSVLVVLIIPRTLYMAQSTSVRILLGMGEHRVLAAILLLEGGANLVLSLFLARRFGVVGVAMGTAIPLVCTSLFFLPQHLCRVLQVPVQTFLIRAYRLPVILGIFQALVLGYVSRKFPAHTYSGVLLQVLGSASVYAFGLLWTLRIGRSSRLSRRNVLDQLLEPNDTKVA